MNASFRFTGLLENTTAGETHKYTDKSGLLPWSVTLFQRRVAKFFFRANNPFLISNFDLWDVELGENGFNYPIQRTFSVGVNFSF